MKKEIVKSATAPAFSVDLAELEVLEERVLELFGADDRAMVSIDFCINNETLKFSSVDDLKEYSDLSGNVPEFNFYIGSGLSKSISISNKSIFSVKPSIWINGEDSVWVASAMETVMSFLSAHKRWYSWILSFPTMLFFYCYAVFMPGTIVFVTGPTIGAMQLIGLVSVALVVLCMFFFRKKILPPATLKFTDEQSLLKRYGLELTLLMAFLSMVFTAISAFKN
jgi:hypothetical protein